MKLRHLFGVVILTICFAAALYACGTEPSSSPPNTDATAVSMNFRQGGMGSTIIRSTESFSLSSRIINHYERQVFADGKDVFEAVWTDDPNAAPVDGEPVFVGLGPRFDAESCASCHANDGRGAGPEGDGLLPLGMVVNLHTDDANLATWFGGQLQRYASGYGDTGSAGEAQVSVLYDEITGTYPDGTTYSLRQPTYSVEAAPSDDATMPPPFRDTDVVSPVVAPQLVGLGLLEYVTLDDLHALADPGDLDGDGISGRLAPAFDPWTGVTTVGRFGWQGAAASVEQQAATAAFNDLGLTNRWFPTDECAIDVDCYRAGGPLTQQYYGEGGVAYQPGAVIEQSHELTDDQLYQVAVYSQVLAVPTVRDTDNPEVIDGGRLFGEIGCTSCHNDSFVTGPAPQKGLSNQEIFPRTDLLLHDMGPGLSNRNLAGEVVPTEWRTSPLWGIGLIETVNGHTTYLHDGRARNLEEAVLWHGGEAESAANAFRSLDADNREALLQYLSSL